MYADAGKNSERVTQSNKRAKKLDGETGVRRYGLVYGLLEQKEDLTDAGWREREREGRTEHRGKMQFQPTGIGAGLRNRFSFCRGFFPFSFHICFFLDLDGKHWERGPGEHSGSTDGTSPQIWAYGRRKGFSCESCTILTSGYFAPPTRHVADGLERERP